MRNRVLLGALFVALIVVSRLLLPGSDADAPALPEARAEYRLEDFELTVMNLAGERRYVIEAPLLERNPEDGSASVRAPDIRLFDGGAATWAVAADTGWVDESGEEVRLAGDVVLESLEPDPTRIVTEALTVFPDDERAESDARVLITGPRGRVEGVGLRADLESRAWELLSEVRIRLLPSRL